MRSLGKRICIGCITVLIFILCTACQLSGKTAFEQLLNDAIMKQAYVHTQNVYYLDNNHTLWGMGQYNMGLDYTSEEWHSQQLELKRPVKIAENVKGILRGYESLYGYISLEGDLYLWGNAIRKRVPTKMDAEKMITAAITANGSVLGIGEAGNIFLAYVPEETDKQKYDTVLQEQNVTAIYAVEDTIYLCKEDGELVYYDASLQKRITLLTQIKKFVYSCAGDTPHCMALMETGELYEWGVPSDNIFTPIKVQENVIDVACGAEYTVWIDTDYHAYFSGYWTDTSSAESVSTFFEKQELCNVEEGAKEAIAVFADYENVYVIFADENCMAWGQNWDNAITGLRERETDMKGYTYMPYYFYLDNEGSLMVSQTQQKSYIKH